MKKEHKLIGNLLADDNDSDEEFFSRYQTTKRHILLNKDELSQLTEHRSTSAPIIQPPDIFSSPL